jgi:hypothetical protein
VLGLLQHNKSKAFIFFIGKGIYAKLVRIIPLVLNMWFCKLKLDEEKSKHAFLA